MEESPKTGRSDVGPLGAFGPEVAQFFVVSLWASTFIVTKAVFAEMSPLAFAFVRFALMTVLAFGILALRSRGRLPPIRRADLILFLMAGLTGYTLYQLGFVLGLDYTSPFSSSLLIAMVPFFTMIFLALRGERPPRQDRSDRGDRGDRGERPAPQARAANTAGTAPGGETGGAEQAE